MFGRHGILLLSLTLLYSGAILAQSANSVVYSSQVDSFLKPIHFPSVFSAFKQGHFILQAGGYWSSQGKAQHIDIDGLIGDEFTATRHDDSNGLVGFGYFIDGPNLDRVQLSYGANFFYLPKTSVSGTVIQEDLFTNLSYDYEVTHYPLYAVAKATMNLSIHNMSLTVDAGIGSNFMHTNGFTEHSLDGGITRPDNAFSGHTKTAFSTTAGIGLQLANVFGETPLECGYRFLYLGQGRFSKKTEQLTNTLYTGTAYAHAVLCAMRI